MKKEMHGYEWQNETKNLLEAKLELFLKQTDVLIGKAPVSDREGFHHRVYAEMIRVIACHNLRY